MIAKSEIHEKLTRERRQWLGNPGTSYPAGVAFGVTIAMRLVDECRVFEYAPPHLPKEVFLYRAIRRALSMLRNGEHRKPLELLGDAIALKPKEKKHMKGFLFAIGLSLLCVPAFAWNTDRNPDRVPSLGVDLIKGQQAGIARGGANGFQTDGGLVGARVDYRLPMTNALTFHFAGESLGINNNMGYTDGYRLEVGGRFFFQD